MSTRGLYGFIENGEYTATYNHSDSYPSGLGLEFFTAAKIKDFSGMEMTQMDGINFILDSLFCEWAYFYNRDNDTFEVWKGSQNQPDPTNIFGQEGESPFPGSKKYYPCRLIFRDKIENISEELFKDNRNFTKIIERDDKLNDILNK